MKKKGKIYSVKTFDLSKVSVLMFLKLISFKCVYVCMYVYVCTCLYV